jgi:hypothetical protein
VPFVQLEEAGGIRLRRLDDPFLVVFDAGRQVFARGIPVVVESNRGGWGKVTDPFPL